MIMTRKSGRTQTGVFIPGTKKVRSQPLNTELPADK